MFVGLFEAARAAGVPVSLRELLDLNGAVDAGLVFADTEALYRLARIAWVKDERHYDRFDRAFAAWLDGVAAAPDPIEALIPDEWMRRDFLRSLSDEERARIATLGGLDALLAAFRERLAEQKGRHAGGNRWIGTGGTSPFGSDGYHPEGIRVGPRGSQRRAVKVWEQRAFRDLADDVELGTRNLKLALRRLRRFARQGTPEEFDIDGTIDATARDAGLLNVRMRAERRNAVKVLLLLDVGGSMDDHVRLCESLFSAARSEFKRLATYYFHNCVYEHVWTNGRARYHERTPTVDLLRTHPPDTRLVLVGDAAMAPYEVTEVNGSIEHANAEPGAVWLSRLAARFPKLAWINPVPREHWHYAMSTGLIRGIVEDRMFGATPEELGEAMRVLAR